jgi:hypothetical protein
MRRELPRFSSRWKHTRRSIGGWRLTISDWKWRLELTIDESRALRCDGDSLLSLLQQRFPDDYSLSAPPHEIGAVQDQAVKVLPLGDSYWPVVAGQ